MKLQISNKLVSFIETFTVLLLVNDIYFIGKNKEKRA